MRKPKCRFLYNQVKQGSIWVTALMLRDFTLLHEEKLKAIVETPAPKSIQELRSFLSLINYYGKFNPNAATVLAPLNVPLRKGAKWKWDKECKKRFEQSK